MISEDLEIFQSLIQFAKNEKKSNIRSYYFILIFDIYDHEYELQQKGIAISTLISKYMEYMMRYLSYQNMIDYDEFLENYLEKLLVKDCQVLHRQHL